MISELASTGLSRIYGAAVSSFGWEIGRKINKNFGNFLLFIVICLLCFGGFYLPYTAGRRWTQWHSDMGKAKYFFRIFFLWLILLVIGIAMLWVALFFFCTVLSLFNKTSDAQTLQITNIMTWIFGIVTPILGAIKGMTERRKRKRVYAVMMDNQNFLDSHGIREVDGGSVTHVDGDNNRMKLNHIGNDLIEFAVSGGRKAFITVAPDGRFIEYSGAVSG